ncbi:putative leucine carboxyl methyltransferase 1 [Apostichopus japonicus]|uniref:Leucine carboxyl methyltransferase 1 n=1 Tax=Stichopus japonicus TaxID=307972 RepID=A0A2G8LHE4_STIJA|nr:putative leucine carboxyl methyltransferase 1 [Apostichopus japonicus]
MGDEAVQSTNDDASQCKRFAVQKGYWKDPYIQYLVRSGDRRAPEINRGYFARVRGIKVLLDQFLEKTKCSCQVVNFGAGFDTLFWKLKDENKLPDIIVDFDFRAVTSRKCQYVKVRPPLLDQVKAVSGSEAVQIENAELHSPKYHIMWADLRNTSQIESKLRGIDNFDFSKPTVFITECVLVYLQPDKSSELIKWAAESFANSVFINYEQVHMSDKFGQVMVSNLRGRRCELEGIAPCQDLDTQKLRFVSNGFDDAVALEMGEVYRYLPADEVHRVERLEFLDETELLNQLLQHYCLCWAWKDKDQIVTEAVIAL